MEQNRRLIDANKLTVCTINVGTMMFPRLEAFVRVEDIEAASIIDAEEVVRCKDCGRSTDIDGICYCTYWSKNTDPMGYCHEGQ